MIFWLVIPASSLAVLVGVGLTVFEALQPHLPMLRQLYWLFWALGVLLVLWRCVRGRWL